MYLRTCGEELRLSVGAYKTLWIEATDVNNISSFKWVVFDLKFRPYITGTSSNYISSLGKRPITVCCWSHHSDVDPYWMIHFLINSFLLTKLIKVTWSDIEQQNLLRFVKFGTGGRVFKYHESLQRRNFARSARVNLYSTQNHTRGELDKSSEGTIKTSRETLSSS
jgi:hypothetical protein